MNTKIMEYFHKEIEEVKANVNYREPMGYGICKVVKGKVNPELILEAKFPHINWGENLDTYAAIMKALGIPEVKGSEFVAELKAEHLRFLSTTGIFRPFVAESISYNNHANIHVLNSIASNVEEEELESGVIRFVAIYEDTKVESVEAAYLKLYALSEKKAKLRSLNLDGIFGLLTNVAWVDGSVPVELEHLRAMKADLIMSSSVVNITSVDKFPRFLQHVIPDDNTRILDSSKVRMGAQLAAGTTVMPGASYVNFNSGTEGPCMVEGRISSSAVVGSGSDIGGGASILGVLSGTDGNPITIGENCLLGANSVCGIPLGNGCIIDAGLAVLAGTKITITYEEIDAIADVNPGVDMSVMARKASESNYNKLIIKSSELSGLNGIHFRLDSINGNVTAFRSVREVKLNKELH